MSIFVGYSGQVWSAVYAAMLYYQAQLAGSASAGALASLSEQMLASLLNGAAAINANDRATAWETQAGRLASILTLPLSLDATSETYVLNRLAAYQSAFVALQAIVPAAGSFGAASIISENAPVIPDMGLLDYYAAFDYETPPAGLSTSNFVASALFVATAFSNLAAAINAYQGANLTGLYDTATLEAQSAGMAATTLGSLTSGPIASNFAALNAWNQVVTLPGICAAGSVLANSPASQQGQQSAVIRYAMLTLALQVATFLLILRQPTTTTVNTTTLRNNETLMDVAARTLGDFEQWQAIAAINGLYPPYTGAVAAPGVAAWGSQLILPAPGTQLSSLGAVPSYAANVLGTDIYVGPLGGAMPPWTGDYQLITGLKNLSWALGRRIQTSLSSLIYHTDYGSRIPPEVGAIETSVEAQRIAAYGDSAIQADSRVASVVSSTSTGGVGLVQYQAQVQPIGPGDTPVGVNEVISTLPGAA
jgi:hypothetical protein